MAVKRAGRRVREVAAEQTRTPRVRISWMRLAPSGPSLAVGFALLAFGVGAYLVARQTPLFAIERIEIVGAPPAVRERVREALGPLDGESLVGLQRHDVDRPLAAVPDVAAASYDRAFPHTLRVFVRAERPLAVVRRGGESWLLSTRGRVLRQVAKGARPALPRLWVPRATDVEAGDVLADETALRGVRALAAGAAADLPVRIRTVRVERAESTLLLRNGVEVRLGRDHDLRLKLAVAAAILPQLASSTTYLDVAVPDRPVAGQDGEAQVEVDS